jgi:hypothetical protein
MATITLVANTNVSALTLANGDTIDLAGFQLNFDVQPTATGIQVITPGTAGTCAFPVACVIPTWSFTAGTGTLIATLPANCEIGSVTGGTGLNADGINTNNGTVSVSVTGGSGNAAMGVRTNNSTISGTVTGGTNTNAFGVNTNSTTGVISGNVSPGGNFGVSVNNGLISGNCNVGVSGGLCVVTNNNRITGNVTAGSTSGAAIQVNNGEISGTLTAGGGASAHGCVTNNGTILNAIGGTNATAHGVNTNNGLVLGFDDNTAFAVNVWNGRRAFVLGPQAEGRIPNNIKTIYSLGALSGSATIAGDATVITLSEGTGGSPGFTGIGRLRRLGK